MPTPTLLLGRLRMREDRTAAEQGPSSGERSLNLSGQESIPRHLPAAVERRREDFLSLAGKFISVSFEIKNYLDGFYNVEDVQGTIEDWEDGLKIFRWSASLRRVGTEYDVDIESRLSGSASRQNNFTIVGERSHAPAIGHSAYWTDATVTSAVNRVGSEGTLTVYRGIATDVSPRWIVAPAAYGAGRVKLVDELGIERAGDSARVAALGWELDNGLVRVRPLAAGGVLEISAWTGGTWRAKNWDVLFDAVSVGAVNFTSVLNNDNGIVTVRMTKAMTNGRLYVDVTLRRGYRFAEVYVQSEYGGTIKIVRATTEAGTNALGGTVVANANDADGNKFIVGSSRTFVADTVSGGLSIAATPVLDAFVGAVVAGTSAVEGDQADDLQKQYIGAPTEYVQGVKR